MRKELGKWLMDIAKYMATALILTTIFKDMSELVIFWMAFFITIIALICGLILVKDSNNNKKKGKRK